MKAMWTVLLMLAVCASAFALAPAKMSYQGVLKDSEGELVPNGNYDLQLSLYDAATGGTALWTEAQNIGVTGGVFSVILGSVTPLALPFDKAYYLGVGVNTGAEMTPRTLLTSAAYALNVPVVGFGASPGTTALTSTGWVNYDGDSVTVVCPGPGYVVVQSSAWMQAFHVNGVADRFFVAHGTTPTEGPLSNMYVACQQIPAALPTGTYEVTLPVLSQFAVTAAGSYTYFLNGNKAASSTSDIQFWYANTVATYYPGTPPAPDLMRASEPMKPMPVGR